MLEIDESDTKIGYRWEECSLSLKPGDKISKLNEKIQERTGIWCEKQKLFVHTIIQVEEGGESYEREANIQLEPTLALRNYNLEKGAFVYCVDEKSFMDKVVEERKEDIPPIHKLSVWLRENKLDHLIPKLQNERHEDLVDACRSNPKTLWFSIFSDLS